MSTSIQNGSVLKFGETISIRFEIPDSWDRKNITKISVIASDEDGAELDSGTATIFADSALDAAVSAHDTSVVLASGAEDLFPGDRISIGADGEIVEIREVVSYDSTTLTAVITPELDYAHADAAPVCAMWASYDLDLSDTDIFQNKTELWVRWNPDSTDPEYVQQYVIGKSAFAAAELWEEFQVLYPTEYARLLGRDLDRFEKIARRSMKLDLAGKGFDIDKIQNMDLFQDGLIRKMRVLSIEGGGDSDTEEYDRAHSVWISWLDSVSHLPVWSDTDGDKIVDDEEVLVLGTFRETTRYI